MKSCVKNRRLRQLLFLAVAVVLTLGTAFAQETVKKASLSAQGDIKENVSTRASHLSVTDRGTGNTNMTLLNELLQPDSAIKTELTAKEVPCVSNECTLEKPR